MASFDISYTYDPVGNRRTMTDHLLAQTTTYTYDAGNQLLTAVSLAGTDDLR